MAAAAMVLEETAMEVVAMAAAAKGGAAAAKLVLESWSKACLGASPYASVPLALTSAKALLPSGELFNLVTTTDQLIFGSRTVP